MEVNTFKAGTTSKINFNVDNIQERLLHINKFKKRQVRLIEIETYVQEVIFKLDTVRDYGVMCIMPDSRFHINNS